MHVVSYESLQVPTDAIPKYHANNNVSSITALILITQYGALNVDITSRAYITSSLDG
jgi:hypothetical protein